MKTLMKKLVKALLFLNFFLPIALLLKFVNYFYLIRICEINSLLGGNIDLYPYIIKKKIIILKDNYIYTTYKIMI